VQASYYTRRAHGQGNTKTKPALVSFTVSAEIRDLEEAVVGLGKRETGGKSRQYRECVDKGEDMILAKERNTM
jgi:hypothetical protein